MKIWDDKSVQELPRAQLLDEHRTIHAFFAMVGKEKWRNHPLMKYPLEFMQQRHEEQIAEMLRRGYSHHSPLEKNK